ncbi:MULTISPECIES: hypothetical protein [unclassified Variovorax]|uniref:hypothetical protein n=1 Tax=unclassified Variovorax TaxID=663243 RepID=UPI0008388A07|nr:MULTISPECIES: hypothetical protein [unclassified Variovorax]PNG48902.1 hypothetical protein CHC06_06670 [Variovorax sp. B2]PNG49409.1 hypothetical protein CHC07_06318 [Variovorax sp. B4]VTV18284.1 hypothetical protein WDL1P2_00006 [Variovorax sp. WDL1]
MSVNDNIMDIRVRFHRDESPMLFRALSGMESAPGVRTRNQFVRQLIEMGLLMMEERMRRQDGVPIRVSSGLTDEVTASAVAMARTSGLPAAIQATPETRAAAGIDQVAPIVPAQATSLPTSVVTSPSWTETESARPRPHQATAPPSQIAQQISPAAVRAPAALPVGDDDRPPPRVGAVRPVRMLDGESFE